MTTIVITLGAISVMTASLWSRIGPGHGAFPCCITLMSLAFPIFIGAKLAKRIPSSLVSISARSNRFFNVLGVKVFDRVLTSTRWNALVLGLGEPVTKPSDLPSLSFDLRCNGPWRRLARPRSHRSVCALCGLSGSFALDSSSINTAPRISHHASTGKSAPGSWG
jgi:hypothetical protein